MLSVRDACWSMSFLEFTQIYIAESLSWRHHLNYIHVNNKMSRTLYAMKQGTQFFNQRKAYEYNILFLFSHIQGRI